MSDTPRTDAFAGAMESKLSQGHDGGMADYYEYACRLERELTKAINAARFMAAYLEDRGEKSGRAYLLCREVGWSPPCCGEWASEAGRCHDCPDRKLP